MSAFLGELIHSINSKLLISRKCIKVACSESAGKWMFGKAKFTILDNAVNVAKYSFNEADRVRIRKELNIEDNKVVIGNVSRFVYAKNHKFMIELFNQYLKFNPETILLLVGDGPLKREIQQLAQGLGINDKVVFNGQRTDIPQMLSSMDCFLFPSHFEGLGFVAVEAEANGLFVVASDKIPKVVNIDNHIKHVPLSAGVGGWISALNLAINETNCNDRGISRIRNTSFDLEFSIQKLIEIYSH